MPALGRIRSRAQPLPCRHGEMAEHDALGALRSITLDEIVEIGRHTSGTTSTSPESMPAKASIVPSSRTSASTAELFSDRQFQDVSAGLAGRPVRHGDDKVRTQPRSMRANQ